MSNFVKKLPILLLFFCASPHTWAYKDPDLDKTDREARNTLPYVRGGYSVGITSLSGAPREMELNLGSSRSDGEEVCCYFPTRLSWLFAGFGIKITNSTWNFRRLFEFQREGYDGKLSWNTLAKNDPYGLYKLLYKWFPNNRELKSTSLRLILLELRFPEFRINIPESGFWVSLGNVISRRYGYATQHKKYNQYGEKGLDDAKVGPFHLRRYLWGLKAEIGWRRWISIYYTHTLTGLFEKDKGPKNGIRPWSIGVSISIN